MPGCWTDRQRRLRGARGREVAAPARLALDCTHVKPLARIVVLLLVLVALPAAPAWSSEPAAAPAAAPAPDGDAPYVSPLRATWQAEIAKDPELKADIEQALRFAVHRDESAAFARNNRHVVMAYIAIWVLTAGFLAALWLRQGRLRAEIARLEAEVARAARDAGA